MEKYKFKIKREHAEKLQEYLDSSLNKFSYLKKRENILWGKEKKI